MFTKILFSFLGFSTFAFASQYRGGEYVQISGTVFETLFAAGQRLNSNFESNQDIFLAGREIIFKNGTSENLFLAGATASLIAPRARMAAILGGDVFIERAKFHDLVSIGKTVRVNSGIVEDDFIGLGDNIYFDENSQVIGSIALAARRIEFNGLALRDVTIKGVDVDINGKILGNVSITAERIRVGPNAVIEGNLSHEASSILISPSAKILGAVSEFPPLSASSWPLAIFEVARAMLFGLGFLLLPVFVVLAAPKLMESGRNQIDKNELASVGRGLVIVVLSPIILVVMFTSIIGIPLALVLLALVPILILISYAIGIFTIGDRLRIFALGFNWKFKPSDAGASARFWWSLAGAVALNLILLIPVFGILFSLFVLLCGIGALWTQIRNSFRSFTFKSRNDEKKEIVDSDYGLGLPAR